jgi:hypothetical protein
MRLCGSVASVAVRGSGCSGEVATSYCRDAANQKPGLRIFKIRIYIGTCSVSNPILDTGLSSMGRGESKKKVLRIRKRDLGIR